MNFFILKRNTSNSIRLLAFRLLKACCGYVAPALCRKSSIKPVAFEGEHGSRPLVVDRVDSEIKESAVSPKAPLSDMLLDDIDISFWMK